jgi:hypothetical protein
VVVFPGLVVLVTAKVVVGARGTVVTGPRLAGVVVPGPGATGAETETDLGTVVVVAVPVPLGNDMRPLGEPMRAPGNVATGAKVPV